MKASPRKTRTLLAGPEPSVATFPRRLATRTNGPGPRPPPGQEIGPTDDPHRPDLPATRSHKFTVEFTGLDHMALITLQLSPQFASQVCGKLPERNPMPRSRTIELKISPSLTWRTAPTADSAYVAAIYRKGRGMELRWLTTQTTSSSPGILA
jgi:hypothetical protein